MATFNEVPPVVVAADIAEDVHGVGELDEVGDAGLEGVRGALFS